MKAWLVFFLGTLGYFAIKFKNRKDKAKEITLTFWWQDNWYQLLPAVILDLILMIIFMDADTDITVWLTGFLPAGLVLSAKLAGAALCGLGLGWVAYEGFKKKKSTELENK